MRALARTHVPIRLTAKCWDSGVSLRCNWRSLSSLAVRAFRNLQTAKANVQEHAVVGSEKNRSVNESAVLQIQPVISPNASCHFGGIGRPLPSPFRAVSAQNSSPQHRQVAGEPTQHPPAWRQN